jgi:hypothetical protein
MKVMHSVVLAGVVALGGLGLASTAQAQVQDRAVATSPRTSVSPGASQPAARLVPTYRRTVRGGTRYAPRRAGIVPHSVRDWSTGNENLPLAKPWLHNFR